MVQASTNYYARKEQITHTFLIFLSGLLVVGAAKQSLRPGQCELREPANRLSLYAPSYLLAGRLLFVTKSAKLGLRLGPLLLRFEPT